MPRIKECMPTSDAACMAMPWDHGTESMPRIKECMPTIDAVCMAMPWDHGTDSMPKNSSQRHNHRTTPESSHPEIVPEVTLPGWRET
eukprot:1154650-Pelagomonas_calceolata.AAC.3